MTYLVDVLYIFAFALFIYGLMGLTGPKTAVRGNWIAATGMAIAVIATLIRIRDTASINWILIVAGLAIGVILGVPPAKKTKMTAMPQLVALFNGVGGGTVALIAWAEFIETKGFSHFKADQSPTVALVVGSLFAAVIGSVSFWGSLVAFAKLQENIIPKGVEKAFVKNAKLFQAANIVLLLAAVAAAVFIGLNKGLSVWWIVLLLVLAGIMGLFVVFPIGGADMPVVISLLNAMTGLSAAAAGLALNNTAMIVAGMIVGASGSILTNLMAVAMNRSIPAIVFGSFGGADAGGGPAGPARRSRNDHDEGARKGSPSALHECGKFRPGSPAIPCEEADSRSAGVEDVSREAVHGAASRPDCGGDGGAVGDGHCGGDRALGSCASCG